MLETKKKKKIGKLTKRKHLILQEKTIDEFWPIYCEDLKRFRMHRFKYLILGKRYQSDPRKESLRVNQGEFALNHDFTECLSVKHNNEESQSSHFCQGCTVSIEGYTCHYRDPEDGSKLILDFHSYLLDNNTQNAAIVENQMAKLMEFLIESCC